MKRDCYEIITNSEALDEFINWLPELEESHKYYMCLFGRKKYAKDAGFEIPWIKSDKGQLKRLLSDKEKMRQKIEQLECPVGSYKFGENSFPQECLALYITPNPRDTYRCLTKGITQLVKMIECQARNANPHQEMMSEIQRTPIQKKPFSIFDLDSKEEDLIKKMIDIVDGYCDVIETRGGYHLLVHNKFGGDISNKLWYPELKKIPDVDVAGDCMTPVVGSYQGGHSVRFYYRIDER